MAEITAGMVKELRELTGLGMMECKKALTEAAGDMKKAEDLLRIKSGAKASKAAGRVAAEGVIGSYITPDGKTGALVEVNSETDFVAKNDDFIQLAKEAAKLVAENDPADIDALSKLKMASGQTVEEARQALIMKLGENMTVRRIARFATSGKLSVYLHGNKIGVMVDLNGGDETLGKDIAMHVAASKPIAVSKEQVPAENIERERAAAAENSRIRISLDKVSTNVMIADASASEFTSSAVRLTLPVRRCLTERATGRNTPTRVTVRVSRSTRRSAPLQAQRLPWQRSGAARTSTSPLMRTSSPSFRSPILHGENLPRKQQHHRTSLLSMPRLRERSAIMCKSTTYPRDETRPSTSLSAPMPCSAACCEP